jgi:hypothetical protein
MEKSPRWRVVHNEFHENISVNVYNIDAKT